MEVYERTNNVPGTFTHNVVIHIDGLGLLTEGFVEITITCPHCPDIPSLIFRRSGRQPPPVMFNQRVPQTFTLSFDHNFPSLALFPGPGGERSATLVATVNFYPKHAVLANDVSS